MRKGRKCRKCGEKIAGLGSVCDTCTFRPIDENRKGQKYLRASQDVEDDMAYVRKLFNLPPEYAPVPSAILHAWMSNRTMTRKTADDWGGLNCLHRDFEEYAKHEYTRESFQHAVERAGFAVEKGMVSRLILKGDYEAMQMRTQ